MEFLQRYVNAAKHLKAFKKARTPLVHTLGQKAFGIILSSVSYGRSSTTFDKISTVGQLHANF